MPESAIDRIRRERQKPGIFERLISPLSESIPFVNQLTGGKSRQQQGADAITAILRARGETITPEMQTQIEAQIRPTIELSDPTLLDVAAVGGSHLISRAMRGFRSLMDAAPAAREGTRLVAGTGRATPIQRAVQEGLDLAMETPSPTRSFAQPASRVGGATVPHASVQPAVTFPARAAARSGQVPLSAAERLRVPTRPPPGASLGPSTTGGASRIQRAVLEGLDDARAPSTPATRTSLRPEPFGTRAGPVQPEVLRSGRAPKAPTAPAQAATPAATTLDTVTQAVTADPLGAGQKVLDQARTFARGSAAGRRVPTSRAELAAQPGRRVFRSSAPGTAANPALGTFSFSDLANVMEATGRNVDEIAAMPLEDVVPLVQAAARKGLKSQSGGINPAITAMIARGGIGAAVGSTLGEDTQDHIINGTVIGLGAALAPQLYRGAGRVAQGQLVNDIAKQGIKFRNAAERVSYFGMLSNPVTIMKAYAGATSGAFTEALERISTGAAMRDPTLVRSGVKIFSGMFGKRFRRQWWDVMRNADKLTDEALRAGRTSEGALGLPTRLIGAFDKATTDVVTRATGMSLGEAQRLNLSGPGMSFAGKKLIELAQGSWWVRQAQPFTRVGVQFLENGVRRSPLRRLAGATRLSELSRQQRGLELAKQVTGASAVAFGAERADNIPSEFIPLSVAAAGPAGLPFLVGILGRKSFDSLGVNVEDLQDPETFKRFIGTLAGDVGTGIGEETPFIGEVGISPERTLRGIPGRFVPNLGAFIARATDTADRDTSVEGDPESLDQRLFGTNIRSRLKEKIPGLRQTLPEAPVRVGPFGEPEALRSQVRRAVGPPPREGPGPNPSDPLVLAAKALDIPLRPPLGSLTAQNTQGIRQAIPLSSAQKQQLQEMQGRLTRHVLQEFSDRGVFTNLETLTDDQKALLSQAIKDRMSRLRRQLTAAAKRGLS